MLPTITIFLLAAALVIATIVCLIFLSVAFASPHPATAGEPKQWQPPLDDDETLVYWAARMAAGVTAYQLSLIRSSTTATQLAEELYAGAANAMEQLREEAGQCPARCHEMIGVTAPEALALAGNVRTQGSDEELNRIRNIATSNAAQTEAMNGEQYAAAHVTCPLLTNDGTCAAYPLRPLFCRTDCAGCGSDDSAEPRRRISSSSLALGIGRGLATSLADAGVDANRYELNSALLVSLSGPDVSKQWASGEPVFAKCKLFGV